LNSKNPFVQRQDQPPQLVVEGGCSISTTAIIQIAPDKFALVDASKVAALAKFKWRAVQHRRSWYARASILRNGVKVSLSMHRFVARTPFGMQCHHLNENSLDNRRSNLANWTKKYHDQYHSDNKILVKFEQKNR
jgi:hypothetical protein